MAQVQDRDGARLVFERIWPTFPAQTDWADGGLRELSWATGSNSSAGGAGNCEALDPIHAFEVQPHRWIVKRALGWVNRERRLSRGYGQVPETSEAWVYVTMIRLMLRRLARPVAV